MVSKKEMNRYIEEIEKIQKEFPEVGQPLENLIDLISDDYATMISKELERQKARKLDGYDYVTKKEEYKKVNDLGVLDFLVLRADQKEPYRSAKNRIVLEHPERRFAMRFIKGVGTILTRIQ